MKEHVNRHDHDRNFSDDLYWTGNQYGNAQDSYWNNGYQEDENLLAPRERNYVGKGPKGYRRSDESIKEDVCKRLFQSHDIDASDLEVDVNEGTVSLTGTVPFKDMKHYAEFLSMGVSGVQFIANKLEVRKTS
jgi:osmotically-inducible protein OsmY